MPIPNLREPYRPPMSKEARNEMKKANARRPRKLVRWPLDQMTELQRNNLPPGTKEVWLSQSFLVQVVDDEGHTRISVNRTTCKPNGNWEDGISWDELQRIKHDVGYGDRSAVEVYPRDSDVIYDANIRHLWVLPQDNRIGWEAERGTKY